MVVLKFILWICECRQKPKIRVVVRSYIQKSHRNRTTVTDSGDSSSSYRIVQAKLLIMDWVCYPCITKWLSNLQLHDFSPISRAWGQLVRLALLMPSFISVQQCPYPKLRLLRKQEQTTIHLTRYRGQIPFTPEAKVQFIQNTLITADFLFRQELVLTTHTF